MTLTTLVKTSCMSGLLTLLSIICLAQPHANFSAMPTSGCAPLVVNFSDLSTGNPTSWKWTLGNSTTSFLQNPSVTYFTPGTYSIKLVVQNAAGKDSLTKTSYITIYGKPNVDFSASATAGCFPLNINFTDLSSTAAGTIDSWQWDFGDGQFSTTQNPFHTYTASGNYNVSLRVRNTSGCYQTITRPQYINIMDKPHAGFTNSISTSCTAPINIYFQNTTTGTGTITYLWNFGDGFTSIMPNPSHSYATGSYIVNLIATNSNGCRDTFVIPTPINIGNAQTAFNSPATVCAGTTFTIANNSTPAPVISTWTFGDGTTSTVVNPVKSYTVPGTYLIKLVNNFGTCADSLTKMITVLPKPVTAFNADITGSCLAPLTVNFSNASVSATLYQWNFGDGSTSTQANPVHVYTNPGSYNVTLVTTGANGCTDTLIKPNFIQIQPPVATINDLPQEGCAPLTWTFSSTNNTTEPVTGYLWNFGDGTTSTLENPTHVFAVGEYDIQLIITTASGCRDTVIFQNGIRAGVKPVVNFSATPREACAEVPINFTDLSTGNATDWLWDFGDGGTSIHQNPEHEYTDTGYFPVQLIVYNNGCSDTLLIDNYIHIDPPIAAFLVTANCSDPLRRIFSDRSVGADTYSWDFGDGTTSNIASPVHVFPAPGLYVVTLTVTNSRTGCSYSRSANIRVIEDHPDFSATNTTICRNTATTFTAIVTNPGNFSAFQWTFGDATTGSGRIVSHTYSLAGYYTVRLITININGCRDTIIKNQYIRVNGPTANFSSTTPGTCLLSTVNFTDSSLTDGINPIVRWIWNYGDGVRDTLTAPPFQHTYATPGIYSVSLTVTDNAGCSNTIIKANLLTVSKPVANFRTSDTASCPDRTVSFTNSSTGPMLTYLWHFGDGGTSIATNPTHNYLANGNFSVKLVVVDRYGCTDSLTKTDYIAIRTPQADFTASDTLGTCPPLVVDFTNTSQNYTSMSWDFGDGSNSQSPNPSHFYSIPGVYILKLTVVGQGGCTSVKEQRIVVRGPQGSFTYGGLAGCTPLTVNFVARTRDRISFIWDFNDGSTLSTPDSVISHTYNIPGEYVPKMILRDAAGCLVPIRGADTIRIHGVTTAFDFNTLPLCNSGTIQFNNTTVTNDPITGYSWNFGNGVTSTLENPSHFYSATGIYYPSLVVHTAAGCVDSLRSLLPVKVVAAPQALIAQTPNGCTPVTISFNGSLAVADTSAITWNWQLGNGNTASLASPSPEVYAAAGLYNVNLFVTNSSGCMDTVQTTVEAYLVPTVDAGVDTLICQGTGRRLSASGAAGYVWTPATGLSCTTCPDPVATPGVETTYIVRGTTEHACTDTDSIIVRVQYPFAMSNSVGDTLCIGSSASLSASGAYRYEWSPSAGLNNTNTASVIATPSVTTNYRVIGTDDKNCFTDTAFIPVTVYNIPTVDAGPDKILNVGQQIDLTPLISPDVTDAVWSPTDPGFRNSFPSITVKPRETTTYHVRVLNPGGCTAEDAVTVTVICNGANVFIPNTFSPNADGANDLFYPRGSGVFSIKSERIFTRWGEVVFEKHNFQANDTKSAWDGTFKGQKLNPDVYVYVIEILCDNNSVLTFKGNVALIK